MAKLLVTASADSSPAICEALQAYGHHTTAWPMLHITERPITPPDDTPQPQAIALTSRYALPAVRQHFPTLPLYLVGHHTAQLARQSGLQVEHIAQTAEALAAALPEHSLYLRGLDVATLLPCPSLICYEAQLQPWPTDWAKHDGILFLSARVAQTLPEEGYTGPLFCMSPRIAAQLPQSHHSHAAIAPKPSRDSLLELIKNWPWRQ